MPAVKKKKERNTPCQSQTLHNFFGAKPVGIEVKPTTAKARTTRKSKSSSGKSTTTYTLHQEVISIESGSDDDAVEIMESMNVKRRKLSPRNPDASRTLKTEDSSCDLKPDIFGRLTSELKENTLYGVARESHGDSNHTATDATRQEVITFGPPILLTSNKSQDTNFSETFQSFGKPFGALAQLTSPNSDAKASSSVPMASSTKSRLVGSTFEDGMVDADLTLYGWEDGDDEDNLAANQDDEENIETTSCQPPNNWNCNTKLDHSVSARTDLIDDCNVATHRTQSRKPDPRPLDFLSSTTPIKYDCAETRPKQRTADSDAFSVLMTSFKENEIWREASLAERKVPPQQKSKGTRRKAPFYKVLTGMPIAVDAFKYGAISEVTAYFLTHAHSDHYTNLSSSWKHGPIYCSQGTANLIIHMLSVDSKWVHPLPMDTPTLIPNTDGVSVTLIEANHCPGSCLFFFEGPQTVNAGDSTFKSSFVGSSRIFRYLHCGDFRASPQHVLHPAVKNKVMDLVYLDTTYLDPKYTFPPQPLVISACAEVARRAVWGQPVEDKKSTMFSWMSSVDSKGKGKEPPKVLVVVGTYSIGKERIVKAIAHALNSKVYCDTRKAAILRCQGDKELDALLTSNPLEAVVHLVPLSTIDSDHMKTYLNRFKGTFSKIIGFRPTGWTYTQAAGANQLPSIASILAKGASLQDFKHTDLKISVKSTSTLQLYPVPYSEHSSFYELTCFAMSVSWVKMIATVNIGNETSRGKMAKWVAKWDAERRKRSKVTIVPHRHPDYW